MDKNVHDIDDPFRHAYENTVDTPSAFVWDKISGDLDKIDIEHYKKRAAFWRIVAITIPLVLSSLFLYESKIRQVILPEDDIAEIPSTRLPSRQPSQKIALNKQAEKENNAVSKSPSFGPLPTLAGGGNKEYLIQAAPSFRDRLREPRQDFVSRTIDGTLQSVSLKVFKEELTTNTFIKLKRAQTFAGKIQAAPMNKPIDQRWIITSLVTNEWTRYELEEGDHLPGMDDERNEILGREKHEFSYAAALMLSKPVGRNLQIRTGVIYANTSIAIAPQELYASLNGSEMKYKYIASSGYGYVSAEPGYIPNPGDSAKSTEAKHNLHTVTIPLLMGYQLRKGRLSIMPSAGVYASLITRASLKTELTRVNHKESVYINRLSGMRDLYAGVMADLNLEYQLNKNLSLQVSPNIKYGFSSITSSHVVKTYPYSIGISGGFSFRL